MGCDGIWEQKENKEMVEWVAKRLKQKKTLKEIVDELLDELVSKNGGTQYGMDNMSSILITFRN